MVFRPIDLYVITSTFFTFFQNPKKRDFLRFFAVFHTFSRTMDMAYIQCNRVDSVKRSKAAVINTVLHVTRNPHAVASNKPRDAAVS